MLPTTALKILSDTDGGLSIAGYAAVFGGSDLTSERFTPATNFWLEYFATPPVLYQHGKDALLRKQPVGRVTSSRADDVGVWVTAQIQTSKKYLDAIRQLIDRGVLGFSIGTSPFLMERGKSVGGVTEITAFPMVELSLTPTPAEPRTLGIRELKSLAAAEPLLAPIVQEAERQARASHLNDGGRSLKDLPDSAFAFIEPGGVLDDELKTTPRANRHGAHHDEEGAVDEEMLRVALSQARKATSTDGFAHLLRHARAAGLAESAGHDDAHSKSWSDGAAPALLVLAAKYAALAESVAAEQDHMLGIGMDVKDGRRIRPELCQQLDELTVASKDISDWAKTVDRGEDGTARVNWLRQQLALMELQEV